MYSEVPEKLCTAHEFGTKPPGHSPENPPSMHTPRARSSRARPWLTALTGAALPLAPTLLALFGPSCDAAQDEPPPTPPPTLTRDTPAEPAPPPLTADAAPPPPAAGPDAAPADAPAELADEAPKPIGLRLASRTLLAYAAPSYGSDLRGRIDLGNTLAIYAMVEGTGCTGEGWALADHGSYVCLKNAVASEQAPVQHPIVPEGLVVPYIYAKPRADRKGNLLAEVPRYRNKSAYVSGREPVDLLVANHQYAFVAEENVPGFGKVVVDEDDQVVPITDLKFEKPSDFFGRELADAPVPEGMAAAWAISREAVLRREPKLKAPVEGQLAYHQRLDVKPAVIGGGGSRWLEVPDGLGAGVPGYVESNKLRVWAPGPELAGLADDEVWIDVDLGQQILAMMRGQQATFVTLVSSGTGHKPNTSTPKGIYRIRHKVAHGPMRNRPEDADDSPYHVEAVPWVQYFYKRFALHGAYWHNGFGHRKSHGCVNLAPRDARYVFERTGPQLPPGWMVAYEHAERPGTVVRVRKGQEPVPDRRTEHEPGPDESALLARAEP